MSFGKSSTPSAPDYAALANQQGAQSKDVAEYNTNANRVNQVGPTGSVTWALKPGADPHNPQPGDYTQTTSLTPAQQALQNSGERVSQQYANTAEQGVGRVQQTMGQDFNPTGLPALQGGQTGQFSAQAGVPNQSIDNSNLNPLDKDYEASRQQVQDAYMARMNPSLDQNQQATENRLMNSGIEKGSEAWNREMTNLNNQRTDANSQAILAGGAEQSRLAGLDMAKRQQLAGENQTNATFGNQAQGQQFAQQSTADAARNAWTASQAQQSNAARQQGYQEQTYERSLPLNEVNALRSGAQVSSPQFASYAPAGQAQAAPLLDAGIAQGQYNMAANGNKQSGQNALLGGLANMGAAWLGS